MTWAALIAALVAFLEPLLIGWLQDLFAKLQGDAQPVADAPAVAIHDAFAAARKKLGLWSFLTGKFAVLAAAERVALKHADALAAAARDGSTKVPALTGAECDHIKELA